jgi:FkbM family methyltransferase
VIRKLLSRQPSAPERALPPTCTEDDLYFCFRLLLGRAPSPEEFAGHRVRIGRDLSTVVAEYLASREFKSRDLLGTVAGDHMLLRLPDFDIWLSPSDSAFGAPIIKQNDYEPHVAAALRASLRPGMTFLDVGANIGYFTLLAARLVGAGGRVLAIEPFQQNVKLLVQSLRSNRFDHVEIFPIAASDRAELLTFDNVGSNGQVFTLPTEARMLMATTVVYGMRLDDVLRDVVHVDVVKIDIEGAEHRAVAGARRLLERWRPIILSEFSPPGLAAVSAIDARSYLEALLIDDGYRLEILNYDGTSAPCGRDPSSVIDHFERSGVDHIDIVARPST